MCIRDRNKLMEVFKESSDERIGQILNAITSVKGHLQKLNDLKQHKEAQSMEYEVSQGKVNHLEKQVQALKEKLKIMQQNDLMTGKAITDENKNSVNCPKEQLLQGKGSVEKKPFSRSIDENVSVEKRKGDVVLSVDELKKKKKVDVQ
eukprot:TRINITY_DN8566_c0_g1_i1.p2 TRINITY_DN8566_c0_g1~~TRINITY_DN8566_c0_g1_i1.p2  ORF type:complete len:148 (+),score=21.14 TRINITY_DN8566_c0_g1_i1:87-530(+)